MLKASNHQPSSKRVVQDSDLNFSRNMNNIGESVLRAVPDGMQVKIEASKSAQRQVS